MSERARLLIDYLSVLDRILGKFEGESEENIVNEMSDVMGAIRNEILPNNATPDQPLANVETADLLAELAARGAEIIVPGEYPVLGAYVGVAFTDGERSRIDLKSGEYIVLLRDQVTQS